MQKLADYRKKTVDDWLVENLGPWDMKVGPGEGWISVGSTDPTSDYDISLNKHGRKGKEQRFDYQFVQDFNAWFRSTFGAEGGTVFDTNLYASAPSQVTDPNPEAASTNDVAALMKMRRYMSSGEFEAFRLETMAACGDDTAQRSKVQKQFAAADDNFRIVIAQLLQSGKAQLERRIAARTEQAKTAPLSQEDRTLDTHEREVLGQVTDHLARGAKASGIELYDLQDESEALAHELDHLLKDATLVTTNELYAKQVGEGRAQEQVILLLQQLQKALEAPTIEKDALVSQLKSTKAELAKVKLDSESKSATGVEFGAIEDAIRAVESGDESGFANSLKTLKSDLASELGMRLRCSAAPPRCACSSPTRPTRATGRSPMSSPPPRPPRRTPPPRW